MLTPGELVRLEMGPLVNLSGWHYVLAAFLALLSALIVPAYGWGLVLLTLYGGLNEGRNFIVNGAICVLLPLLLSIPIIACGYCLGARRKLGFCASVAMFECLLFPFGTVLGLCTLSVLWRPRVQRLFDPSLRIWR